MKQTYLYLWYALLQAQSDMSVLHISYYCNDRHAGLLSNITLKVDEGKQISCNWPNGLKEMSIV